MRTVLVIVYIVAMVAVAAFHVVLPAEVAIHFGAGGAADDWGPKWVNTALFAGIYTFFFVMFLWTPRLIHMIPPKYVSLPNAEYWLRPDNRARTTVILAGLMHEFGSLFLAYMVFIGVLTTRANLGDPARLDTGLFITGLVAFLLYTGVWCARLYRDFRIPRSPTKPTPVRPR